MIIHKWLSHKLYQDITIIGRAKFGGGGRGTPTNQLGNFQFTEGKVILSFLTKTTP